MGFTEQPRAVVMHEYKGREHLHVVYSRIDENGQAISDSWNYLHHEKAAREIEQALGLATTHGALYRREGRPRPERTPNHAAHQQGDRLNTDPKAIKAEVVALYQSAADGGAFVAALDAAGYSLAQGDKRAHVIVDQAGGVHSLARVVGAKATALWERLTDYPLENLPTVAEVRATRQAEPKTEKGAHYTSCRRDPFSEAKTDPVASPRPALKTAHDEITRRRKREGLNRRGETRRQWGE